MVFKLMSLVMFAIGATFIMSVDIEHGLYAALIPGVAALSLVILSNN